MKKSIFSDTYSIFIETLIRTLTNDIPRLKACIFGAIERSNIPGWNKDEKI